MNNWTYIRVITTTLNDQNHILENCIGSVIYFFILTQVPFVYMERAGFMTCTAANHQGAIKETHPVWCIWHTYLETLHECRSRHRIGWIIQDFRETHVSRSLTLRLETKMPWRQTPSRKKKAIVFTNVMTSAYQDQLNAGFSKVCEIFQVKSLKYVWEFHTTVCYCGEFPRTETWRWTKRTVIGCLTCRWAGLGQ